MPDERWRDLERRWRLDPENRELHERLCVSLRRAGLPLPMSLLIKRVQPERTLRGRSVGVGAILPEGQEVDLGTAESNEERTFTIPVHREWWVRPHVRTRSRQRTFFQLIEEERPPGIQLSPYQPKRLLTELEGDHSFLRWLALPSLQLGDLRDLSAFSDLIYLTLDGAALGRGSIASLAGLRQLSWLSLARCHLPKEESLHQVARLSTLSYLKLPLDPSPEVVAALEPLTNLTHLDLSDGPDVRGPVVRAVAAALPQLEWLDLSATPNLERQALHGLKPLQRLESIDLSNCSRRLDLTPLRDLPRLQHLRAPSWLSHVEGLQHLSSLTWLDLSPCDRLESLSGLDGLDRLQRLNLSGCFRLSSKDLTPLSELTELTHLDLTNTALLSDGVGPLLGLRKLRRLTNRSGVALEPAAVDTLRRYLPECELDVMVWERAPKPPPPFG